MSTSQFADEPLILAAEVLSLGFLLLYAYRAARLSSRTPPGPKGYPIIGLTFAGLFKDRPLRLLDQWHKEHGSLVFIKILGKPLAFITDIDVADRLLNKRCNALSNKPVRVMPQLAKYDCALSFLQLGHRYNRARRQMRDAMHARAIPAQHHVLERAITDFISALTSAPDEFISHIFFFYWKTLLSFTIGYEPASKDEPIVMLSRKVGDNALSMMSWKDRPWVEVFHIAQNLPIWCMGTTTSRTILNYREDLTNLFTESNKFVHSNLHELRVSSSFLGKLLANSTSEEETSIAIWSSVSIHGGAADTLRSLTASFFMAIMLYPEAQARAQAEIDAVVGRERMPVFSDRANLPYVQALVVELLRWAPPIPLISRAVAEETAYDGYILPKGTTLIANIWGMMHDADRFPEPERFDLGRFYAPDNGRNEAFLQESQRYIHHVVFGFGRRVCPGRFYGDALLWIVVASLLSAFKVSVPEGTPPPEVKFNVDSIIHLLPFSCKIEPRF